MECTSQPMREIGEVSAVPSGEISVFFPKLLLNADAQKLLGFL